MTDTAKPERTASTGHYSTHGTPDFPVKAIRLVTDLADEVRRLSTALSASEARVVELEKEVERLKAEVVTCDSYLEIDGEKMTDQCDQIRALDDEVASLKAKIEEARVVVASLVICDEVSLTAVLKARVWARHQSHPIPDGGDFTRNLATIEALGDRLRLIETALHRIALDVPVNMPDLIRERIEVVGGEARDAIALITSQPPPDSGAKAIAIDPRPRGDEKGKP